jgi:hypothetical protein
MYLTLDNCGEKDLLSKIYSLPNRKKKKLVVIPEAKK